MNVRTLEQLCLRCGLVWTEAVSPAGSSAPGYAGVCPRCGTVANKPPASSLEAFPAGVPNGGST